MKRLTSIIGTLAMAALLFTGCATTNQKPTVDDFTPAIKTAAFTGSFLVLEEHPDWRPYFVEAANELRIIEKAEVIDFATILAIVLRLPVAELKSDDARLAITGATILLTGYQGRLIELDKLENVRPVARALREGIDLALD